MPGAGLIVTHPRAGRVVAARVAVRRAAGDEAIRAGRPHSGPLLGEAPAAARVVCAGVEIALEPAAVDHGVEIDVSVRGAAPEPVWLESVVLGFRWRPPQTRALRYLRNGWQSWSLSESRALDTGGEPPFPSGPWLRGMHHAVGQVPEDRAGWHESELVTVVGAAPSGPACCLGALERGRAFAVLHARREGDEVAIEIELRVDGRVEPGERRPLERVRLALGEDATVLLERFAEAHGRLAGARAAAPWVAGWCSWYHFFHEVSESDVLRNLEALSAARGDLPVEVVQIDDGYQAAVGDWLETGPRFPRGLAPLAREIRAAGFTPGLWTAPFCAVPESRVFREHPDWCLGEAGEPHLGLVHPHWSPGARVLALDPAQPAVAAHLEETFATLVEWGFAYLKLDFLYVAAMEAVSRHPEVARAGRLRRGLEAIRRGAGEEAYLLGCGCPLGAAVGVVDGMRIGPDVAPRWETAPGDRIPGIEETLPSARSAVRAILGRSWMHRRLWSNDPDCVLLRQDSELSSDEARAFAAAVAVTGGSCVFSDDLPAMAEERRAWLAETFALARAVDGLGLPGVARTPDLLAREFPTTAVAASAEGALCLLLNPGDAARDVALPARELGPRAGAGAPALGLRTPRRAADGRLELRLAPHEASLVRTAPRLALFVFCDFDGTFSVQDVGATLAQRHAAERRPAVWARYERGEITAWEYNLEILDGLALPRRDVEAFLHTIELDPGAPALLEWCQRHGVPFRVLSDGFDANLNRLQQLHGVQFAYVANQLRYERGRWRIRATAPDPACGCGTGTCKRGRIAAVRAEHPEATLVHVGNGRVSDLCGALAADLTFAKDSLAEELRRRGEPFEPFETLHDVVAQLERRFAAKLRPSG